MNAEAVLTKDKSPGELFKEKHGYSRTMSRLLNKYGLTLFEYRQKRKKRRLEQQLVVKAKRDKVKAGRKVKGLATKPKAK